MNIPLPPAQEDWLKEQVAAGRFASLEEAVTNAVAQLQAQDAVDDGWAKPLIEEALQALDRGEGAPWRKGEVLERIKARRAPSA
jgi:Arc/MetJ-type ribon-helix-helix transcriptional regulator